MAYNNLIVLMLALLLLLNTAQGVMLLLFLVGIAWSMYTGRVHGQEWCDQRTAQVVLETFANMPVRWDKR